MSKRFCRIIENKKGDQLLLRVQPSEDHDDHADLVYTFKIGQDSIISLTMGGLEWDKAHEALEQYDRKAGLNILKDPVRFIKGLTV